MLKNLVLGTAVAAAALGAAAPAFADDCLGDAPAPAPVTQNGAASLNGQTSEASGFLSGNVTQIPVKVPVNVCGLSFNVGANKNPADHNVCENH